MYIYIYIYTFIYMYIFMCVYVLVTFELIKKIRAVALVTILALERMNQTPQEVVQRRGPIAFHGVNL